MDLHHRLPGFNRALGLTQLEIHTDGVRFELTWVLSRRLSRAVP